MKLHIDVPDRVWGQLASLADNQHTKVSTLLEAAIKSIIQPEPKNPAPAGIPRTEADQRVNAQIEILRGLGYSAPEISRRLGMSDATIRYRMKKLGLPNVRSYNRKTNETKEVS